MKNIFTVFCLLLSFIFILSSSAQTTLQTGIEWTEDSARVEAMKNIEKKLDLSIYKSVDPAFVENLQAREFNDIKIANRQVTFFEQGYYAVAYDGEKNVNYYKPDGSLQKVSICSEVFGDNAIYPRKCVEYGYPEGRFLTVSLDVSPDESFVFQLDGVLLHHWKGNEGIDTRRKIRWERWQ